MSKKDVLLIEDKTTTPKKTTKKANTKKKPNKYERLVKPKLSLISDWSEKQITEREIAENLGVSYSTYNHYKTIYPEIQEEVDKGRSRLITDVKGSLKKKAIGHFVEESTVELIYEVLGDEEIVVGKKEKINRKYIAPDVGAIVLLLKQYDRESITGHSFTNRDEKEERDKEKDLELKERKVENDEW